jgi:O-antigen/teichoic acid export membrane protein
MGVAFVPLYMSVLGTEAYGLIGVFAILQAGMALLDLGLTPTLTREMARLRSGAHTPASIRDLLRSLEVIYCILAVAVVLATWLIAPWLATAWIKSNRLGETAIVQSLRVMGFVLATRWLEQVYRGALQGLQDLVWLNSVQAILATIRWGGAFLVVSLVSPTIVTFFAWQGLVSILTVGILLQRTYRILPTVNRAARFNLAALREIRGFASGMFLGTFLSLLLSQADKFIISKMLSLEQFAYYTLASTVASGLLQLIVPMNTAVYPRLTDLVARQDETALGRTYQRSCEWMAAVLIPPSLLLVFFPGPTLLLWTGNSQISESVAPLLSLLVLGTLCNGLMNLPYMLQLAHGWTSLTVMVNLAAVAIIIPGILWAVPRYGAIGAGCAWLILNASYLLVVVHLMHMRVLSALKWHWYRVAVVQPLVAGSIMAVLLRALLPIPGSRVSAGFVDLVSILILALAIIGVLPAVRETIWRTVHGIAKAIIDHVPSQRHR